MGTLAWIVGVVAGLGFLMTGVMKLSAQQMAVDMLTHVGAADKRMLIGAAEVAGGIGLIFGAASSPGDGEWLGVIAALGLIVTMVLAVQAHLKAGDTIKDAVPAIVMGLMTVVYIVALLGNN